jgi:hypothetical protein
LFRFGRQRTTKFKTTQAEEVCVAAAKTAKTELQRLKRSDFAAG